MGRDNYYSPPPAPQNKTIDEMFTDSLRDLVQRHLAWTKPASREHMVKTLIREAEMLKASIKR